jgi:hypothetical protein
MYSKTAASKGGISAINSSTVKLVKSHTSVVWVGRSRYRNMACASFRARHSITQIVMNSIDIFTPFQDLRSLSERELVSEMHVDRFAAYPNLDCLADANRLLIVTLRAPRKLILNRWLGRVARDHREMVRTNLTRIYSDASDDRLFNRLYEVWYGFLDSMTVAERWRADVSGDTETIIPEP